MKKVSGIIALLSCHCVAAGSPTHTKTQNPAPVYMPCTQDGYQQFLIRHWHGIAHNDSTEGFSFELHANFSGYAVLCHRTRRGDANSGWTSCDSDDDDGYSSGRFRYRFSAAAYFDFKFGARIQAGNPWVIGRTGTSK
ncbi:uncharacterized protein F4812DRAFT_468421 [Daldinia caldariorum]|uniref:uncharacterized protein n=1 Tax=Daldinia caldariorum TaxID=326644 RepID=UPI0020079FD3|nr:uncharacterized protein F4812DRAFT_468421 [Daldinia caldariorum]KAI1463807.1 hypothetical protein F4812DRAFT_468421 [Daldinia caldariorum]